MTLDALVSPPHGALIPCPVWLRRTSPVPCISRGRRSAVTWPLTGQTPAPQTAVHRQCTAQHELATDSEDAGRFWRMLGDARVERPAADVAAGLTRPRAAAVDRVALQLWHLPRFSRRDRTARVVGPCIVVDPQCSAVWTGNACVRAAQAVLCGLWGCVLSVLWVCTVCRKCCGVEASSAVARPYVLPPDLLKFGSRPRLCGRRSRGCKPVLVDTGYVYG